MKAEYVDHLGDDLRVVNAARVSFDKESDWATNPDGTYAGPHNRLNQRDVKLIDYLARNGHWTPFAHPQVTIRETVPIFVARQRFKHMIGFTYNEVSRRYVDDTPEFYQPEIWRSRPDGSVKQGSGTEAITSIRYWDYCPIEEQTIQIEDTPDAAYQELCQMALRHYTGMIESGVAPEQARMVLPQSMYTSYYVTGSLAAWARAYRQRRDSHAQQEIQDLAGHWDAILQPLFPISWSALVDGG